MLLKMLIWISRLINWPWLERGDPGWWETQPSLKSASEGLPPSAKGLDAKHKFPVLISLIKGQFTQRMPLLR